MISDLINVPPGWQKAKFGEFTKNIVDRIDKPKESGLKDYIGLDQLDTDEIRIKRFGSTEDVEATKFLCKKGDIIFGKRNAYLRKVAVTDKDAVASAHSMVLRPKVDKIETNFLPFFMQSSQFWKTAQAISEGSMSPTIKWKTLSAQEFWLPSRNEQRKIAEILWSIESNTEKMEQLIKVAEKLKKGLFEELLTKGIGHKEFKDTEIGRMPEEWGVAKLKDICDKIQDGTHFSPKPQAVGVPYITSKNIRPWGIDLADIVYVSPKDHSKIFKRCDPKLGDVLYVKDGVNTGTVTINTLPFEFTLLSSVVMIRPKTDLLEPRFLKYALDSPILKKKHLGVMTGTAIRRLTLNRIKNLKIPVPSVKEQRKIVTLLDSNYKFIEETKNALRDLTNLRKKLTNSLLSGELLIPKEETD